MTAPSLLFYTILISIARHKHYFTKEDSPMLPKEPGVLPPSDYFVHTASAQATRTFLYPVCLGHFYYSDSYRLYRNTYNSFLIMYMKKGQCQVNFEGQTFTAKEGQIVLLDCYKPHGYYTTVGWEALWIHFDGISSRAYYDLIAKNSGCVITLQDNYTFLKYFHQIYDLFHNNDSIKEAVVSKYIVCLLTELLVSCEEPAQSYRKTDAVEETIRYISEHLCENLSLEFLAARASLSPYYFTRVFKKETGFSPHEYLIASRINAAKFLLKTSDISIKEICFSCGFSNESNFCSTFRKWMHMTPSDYRAQTFHGSADLPGSQD